MTREQIQDLLADALREKYEILQWVGGGGMAQVYLARHRIHGALFAVKVLSLDLAQDERIVERFVQEARTAATLAGHPNIVPIFDIGAKDGLYFLIMQYVEGEDLAKYLKNRTRLNPNEAARMICQVAEALVWAGAKNVIHRDLKPSNLYMDRSGRIMVLDFGIAKAADVPSNLTLASERVGTPFYMSPEQIRGEPCDVRSDLYSLGVVFFELLSGQRPFDGDTYREIEVAHVEKAPPNLRELGGQIPNELCTIVYKLLRKDPRERYQSAKELVSDLNRYGTGNGDAATVVSTLVEPAKKQPGANRLLIAAIAFVALLVIAIGGYLLLLRSRPAEKSAAAPSAELPVTKVDRLGQRMRLVPAGGFIFGNSDDPHSPNEKENVVLPAFYIDETEVSNASYRKFCEITSHKAPESENYTSHPDFPVTNVSYEDALAYAKWTGKRLPAEKEWEKAARGTGERIYPWGNDAWNDAPTTIQPVLTYPKRVSPYGAYNMAGNVFEWTSSHFQVGPAEIDDMVKTLGSSSFSRDWSIIKGGCFSGNAKLNLFWKTYMRRGWPKDQGAPVIGFRCVSDAK
jgi:eukaryotic-like serine/threonine-protein kinase